MEPTEQATTDQNVHVSGENHVVIVVGRDFHVNTSRPPAKQHQAKKRKIGVSRRWLVSAGVLPFIGTAIFALSDPRSPVSLTLFSGWPEGKTALCRDGWYSQSHHRSGTCSSHGGVARWRFAADDAFWRR